MCGVSGGVFVPGDEGASGFLASCLEDHQRRGPDHEGSRTLPVGNWEVRLGHRRLSIVDLSPEGQQPMAAGADALVVSYNGEIYNYVELREELAAQGRRFRSRSDTEVILAAYAVWGRQAFARLNGMFAIALLDRDRRRLLLVRDRFGIKPLYYHETSRRVLFSSTARPIAGVVGREPDLAYLGRGLARRCFEDESESCQYRLVRSVRPGHVYEIGLDAGALRVERTRFYDLAERVSAIAPGLATLDEETARLDLRSRLGDSVSIRLRADVPVGISLSGGLDSSSVAALATAGHPEIVGFTFGRPDRKDTEGPVVRALERHLGLRVEYVWPDATDMAGLYWRCLHEQDSPFSTGSILAQFAVYRAARRAGIPVILGGQGGDEILMGYRKFLLWQARSLWRSGRVGEAMRALAALPGVAWAEREQWRVYGPALLARRRGYQAEVLRLPAGAGSGEAALPDTLAGRQVDEVLRGGLPTLLRYEDRNSMANSIESRLPFMDYRLVEWAIALPPHLKIRHGYGKYLLRKAMAPDLVSGIVEAKFKRGFDVGISSWVAAGLGAAIREELRRLWPVLRPFVAADAQVDRDFDDRSLGGSATRFAEATAAIWIGRQVA